MYSPPPTSIKALCACRLIPLDENPGLRPFGVSEILRRIIGKIIVSAIKEEVIWSVGSLQVCADHEVGCEAIHSMDLIDADNDLNLVNTEAFIHKVKIICPVFATFVSNCYSSSCRLFIIGGDELKSTKGTTQRDPTAMIIYAIVTTSLILMIIEIMHNQSGNTSKLPACADDFTATETLAKSKVLWNILCDLGPKFGYYL